MIVEVKVPQLAESVSEASLMEWRKSQGDAVQRGDNLIDIETDKVVLEVTAPEKGVIKEIKKQSGEDVASDEVIALIDTESAGAEGQSDQKKSAPEKTEAKTSAQPPPARPASETKASPEQAPVAKEKPARPALKVAKPPAPEVRKQGQDTAGEPAEKASEQKLSPAVRKLLDEHQLESQEIDGSGKDGRITKADVLEHLVSQPAEEAPAEEQQRQPAPAVAPPAGRREQRIPMTRLRQRVAERLLAAQHENAILTTFNEINVGPVMELRRRYREAFEKAHGVRLGFMSFFVMAGIEALKRFPVVNASIDGDDIIYHNYFDIGIAVSSARGLVVPILRDADQLSAAGIESKVQEFARKAKDNKLTLEELTGGNFTITNGGVFGSLLSTPILNPPQSAILGMHKIEDRPIAEKGEVVIRPMMYVALSYDHRLIDGRDAVQFLVTIKEQIEDPNRLLLQI